MSLEHETPEQRREKWNTAFSGLFKGYSAWLGDMGYPALCQIPVELRSGTRDFYIFGSFGEDLEDAYKPEVLVAMSSDAEIRMIARAKWSGEWPEVEGVDTMGGRVTVRGTTAEVSSEGSIALSGTEITHHDASWDELLDIVNKLSLGLRLSRIDLEEQENT